MLLFRIFQLQAKEQKNTYKMKKKRRVSISFSPDALLIRGWKWNGGRTARKEEEEKSVRGKEELKEERGARKRGEEEFWEDVIIRAVNSETGCERQRLAC